MNGGKSENDRPVTDQELERFGYGTKGFVDHVEAWCPACEIAYTLEQAEEMSWDCYCGTGIRKN